jgi:alcohol dehydrogenase
MKAAFISRYGGPEVLEIGDRPVPEVGPYDLLVQVKAASVNPVDFKIRSGQVKVLTDYPMPLILGSDLSGVVTAVGTKVSRFRVDDAIFSRVDKSRIGTFAEFVAVRENDAAPKPENLSHIEAASIPLVGLTAWQSLRDVAGLREGQKVLIHAGAGGVGSFAIQLAKHIGATVATTASSRNLDLVKRLGADVAIDYQTQHFEDVVRDYDVVFDTIDGAVQQRSFQVLKPGGILVTIAGVPTATFMREWGLPFWIQWAGFLKNFKSSRLARARGVRFEYLFMQASGAQLTAIAALLKSKAIVPVVDKVFTLDQAREALAYSEAGHAAGKVIIQP